MQVFVPHVGWMWFEREDEVAEILYRGHFEALEQAFLWLYLRPGDRALDCGAHAGLYSRLMALLVEDSGQVRAFEPDPGTRLLWEKNLANAGGAKAVLHPFGLWDCEKHLRFARESEGMSAHNTILLSEENAGGADEIHVKSLDGLPDVSEGAPWQFVKIDCEGAEPNIVRGANTLLQAGRFSVLMIEFNEHNLQRMNSSTRNLWETIEGTGYALHRFDPETRQLTPASYKGEIWYENLFACRDVDAINQRIRGAEAANIAVADDLLQRARACDCLKELEELGTYKGRAELAESHQRWALNTEKNLAACKEALAASDEQRVKHEAAIGQLQSSVESLQEAHQKTKTELAANQEQLQKTCHALNAQRDVRRQLQARLDRITSSRLVRLINRIRKV